MAEQLRWLALGYSVPVNPSKNRVYVWRKLKEYGAEYFKQGVAVLPYNRQSYTRFKYLSAKILEMGGEASIVEMKFMDPRDEKDMVARFRAQALRAERDFAETSPDGQVDLFGREVPFRPDQNQYVASFVQDVGQKCLAQGRTGSVAVGDEFLSVEGLLDDLSQRSYFVQAVSSSSVPYSAGLESVCWVR